MNGGELFDSKGNFIMKFNKKQKANMSRINWIQKTEGEKIDVSQKSDFLHGSLVLYIRNGNFYFGF